MSKQFDEIVNNLDAPQPQQPSELHQLARIIADGQTWQVCENITNLCNALTTAINYARNNTLLNHDLVGKAINQGMGHLQALLNSIAEEGKALQEQAEQEAQAESQRREMEASLAAGKRPATRKPKRNEQKKV